MRDPKRKFYVAAPAMINDPRGWRHGTLKDAVEHGKRLIESQQQEEVLVVKVVRILRRRPAPIVVEAL